MTAPTRMHIQRYDCTTCQFAFECGSKAWECDTCGQRIDLRKGSQLSFIRDDGAPNVDKRTA